MRRSRHGCCSQFVLARVSAPRSPAAESLRERHGFTLIELVVAIAVAAILVTIAVPSFRTTILNNRRAAAANDFVGAVTYARSIALSRHTPVTVCRSNSVTAASPSCGGGSGWETGWIVFVDNNGSGTAGVIDSGEDILRLHEALTGSTLRGEAAPASIVTFNSAGVTAQSGRFALCDSRGWSSDARVIVLGGAGQIRALPKADDPSGTPLSGCTPS